MLCEAPLSAEDACARDAKRPPESEAPGLEALGFSSLAATARPPPSRAREEFASRGALASIESVAACDGSAPPWKIEPRADEPGSVALKRARESRAAACGAMFSAGRPSTSAPGAGAVLPPFAGAGMVCGLATDSVGFVSGRADSDGGVDNVGAAPNRVGDVNVASGAASAAATGIRWALAGLWSAVAASVKVYAVACEEELVAGSASSNSCAAECDAQAVVLSTAGIVFGNTMAAAAGTAIAAPVELTAVPARF